MCKFLPGQLVIVTRLEGMRGGDGFGTNGYFSVGEKVKVLQISENPYRKDIFLATYSINLSRKEARWFRDIYFEKVDDNIEPSTFSKYLLSRIKKSRYDV